MTASDGPSLKSSPPVEPAVLGTQGGPSEGTPRRSASKDGRARSFREQQVKRRITRRERFGILIVVVIITLGAYTVVTARPYTGTTGGLLPVPGPEILVHLGTPTLGQVNCTAGGIGYVERIPWLNSTQPVTTGEIFVRIFQIWDGDYVPDTGAVANVTPTNLCAGSPPDASGRWYAVLASPNGSNQLSYTSTTSWKSVNGEPWNFQVQDGSSLVVVTYASLAGTGQGFGVAGVSGGSLIRGTVPL
jgi:hypothetical protein